MKKQGVRERIIETASRLFYFNGYNQTGINQIIDEAGVAKASLYQHFRSKEAIAVEYLVRRHTMWMAKLNTYVGECETPEDKITGTFDYLTEWLTEVDFRGCGWQNIIVDLPKDHNKIKDQAVYHKNELRNWIHNTLKVSDNFSASEAEDIGDEVLILIEGAIILSQIQKNEWPIQSAKRACISLLK
ncbi:TetR/AcrR family transcriptional regulator [Lacinutrix jangbogonensis]|uniref:TetR/AcrR family transcriptional regulator n=1 Tax=Lacinutrix jangbogonensis TaxID=1469557 RepID=UPI00053E9203|nr:TetR/AcrR family transcriptional regulator [Lacinutrix jangbogonensis]